MHQGGAGRLVAPGSVDWTRARSALEVEVRRVADLLRGVRDPTAPAVGRWNVAEVAAHLAWAWLVLPPLTVDGDGSAPALVADLWDLADVTVATVEADPERDLHVLAGRIEERARDLLAALDADEDRRHRRWIVEGTRVRAVTLVCHLLNETIVHGHDIARAAGVHWPISRPHAVMVVEGFLFQVLAALPPRALVDQRAARGLRATYQVHVRGGARHLVRFDDGAVTVGGTGPHRVDCHLSVDPAAMMLVVFGRRSQWHSIARGELVAWGRKPWLGPRFRAVMRNP